MTELPPKLSVLGIGVSRTDYAGAVAAIIAAAEERRSFAMTALAVHGVMEGFKNPDLGKMLNEFDLVTPDGQPVRWAMNLLGARELRDRVYGPHVMALVCREAAERGLPVFLFGSEQRVLEALSRNLLEANPNLKIAGMQADRFREATPAEDEEDIATIRRSGAAIVFVGRGCPRQERWVHAHRARIDAPLLAVGAAFDFISGNKPKAPKIMQDHGCEWLFRLCCEPRRMWKRYILLNPQYVFQVTLQLLGIRRYPLPSQKRHCEERA